jgi:predicted esterase/fibronectin type 3 domain-containing protein
MRKFFLLILLSFVAGTSIFGQDCTMAPPSDNKVYPWCYTPNVGTDWDTKDYKAFIINGMPFRLLYPKGYHQNSAETYPLVVFFHGLGQHGTDNNLQLKIGGRNHLQGMEAGKYNGFVMMPQARSEFWSPHEKPKVLAFVQWAIENLRVDPLRITTEGYSAGADMAWKLTTENPLVFAGTSIMSYARASTAQQDAEILKYKAVWHSQGGRDSNPSPTVGNIVAAAFENAGANYRYYFFPELGHGTWWASYSHKDFFPFLQNNSLLNIHARRFKYNFCEGETVQGIMGIQAGFEDYEWKKDGQLLSLRTHEIPFNALGSYTVRLKRQGQWSRWSNPLEIKRIGPSPKPSITADGPTALPSPDGRSTVTLSAPAGMQAYLWSTGATTQSIVVDRGGSYSVSVTEKFGCPSAYSNPVAVTYNAEGNMQAPTNLQAIARAPQAISLSWQDNSNNENGFELYRSTGPNGPWQLAQQVGINQQQATEGELQAGVRYYYQLRAVNNSGGSAYTTASAKTFADAQAPTIPQNLAVGNTTLNSIGLYWSPARDDSNGRLTYELYGNDTVLIASTRQTNYTLQGLPQHKNFRFTVRARDQQGNLSEASNQVTAGTYRNGLFYQYYEGEISTVNDISLLPVIKRGRTANFTISPSQTEDTFAISFEGSLRVPKAGVYTFYTKSKDGSVLSLNGRQLVFNDYTHAEQERSGTIELKAGIYPIKVVYFESYGAGESLLVRWKSNSFELQPIADSLFTDEKPSSTTIATPNQASLQLTEASGVLLQWLSAENSRVEVYRKNSENGIYTLLGASSGQSFQDKSVIGGQTYQYALKAITSQGESDLLETDGQGNLLQLTTPGTTLPKPYRLSATQNSTKQAIIRWENSGNYSTEIWKKAGNQEYKKLSTAAPGAQLFIDNRPGESVSYQVRAVLGQQNSEWSEEVELSIGNTEPVLAGLSDYIKVYEGDTTVIEFEAYDPDGMDLSYATQFFPDFLKVEITNGGGRLIASPAASDIGLYQNLQLTLTDSLLATDKVFTLQVLHSQKITTYVNLGTQPAPAPWNTTAAVSSQNGGKVLENMLNELGEETGYSLTVGSGWASVKPWGALAGPANRRFPNEVALEAYTSPKGNTGKLTLAGLQSDKQYNLVFFGSTIYKSHNGSTLYTVNGQTVALPVQDNIEKTGQLNALSPNENGELIVEVTADESATKGAYLTALLIEEYTSKVAIMRPERVRAHAISVNAIKLSWEDNSQGEGGFEIWQRELPSGEYQLITTAPADATSHLVNNLLRNKGYEFKIRTAKGQQQSDFSSMVKEATLQEEILVNANFTLNMGDPWNNLDRKPVTGDTWYNFEDQDTKNTGVNLRVQTNFDGDNPFGPDADDKGIYHDNVIKTFYYTEVGTRAKMQFYGLNDELLYSFRFFASSAFEGGESGSTRFMIGDKSVYLDAEYNISRTVPIYDIWPEQGKIELELEAANFARYGFLNAMEIEVKDPAKIRTAFDVNQLLQAENGDSSDQKTKLLAYPNPFRTEVTFSFTAPQAGEYELVVLDVAGRKVGSYSLQADSDQQVIARQVDLGATRPGLYLLRVYGQNYKSQTTRIIKRN